ncbi:META domain-containing protein [Candidatus Thiothrix sp. Deng01]|uniref:META domain-containing protein n=1 Tax=Candidatus Thiothrix phosphatis TaxID=3112415 RepID=A0ABU6CRD8_9GAMM|nr:META domain-containing protein [Candidatus Thiothrix sp. Deng01]MEB4589407.1 META domain-containing protein [Candidatus Thiothrix sp. Deng01]
MKKIGIVCCVILALGVGAVQAEGAAGAKAAPEAKLPPIPDAVQEGVVCLLPERYHRNLDGSFWRLVKLNDEAPPEKLDITIGFHNGTVAGYSGCNSYTGTFVNPTDTLFGVKGIETTKRKCEEAVCPSFVAGGNWEDKYLAALPGVEKLEKTDAELKLFDGAGKLVMTFAALK